MTIANHARKGKIKGAIMIHPKMWLIPESEIKNINISHEKSPIKKRAKCPLLWLQLLFQQIRLCFFHSLPEPADERINRDAKLCHFRDRRVRTWEDAG